MSEFIVKVPNEWVHAGEKLPEIGKTVEVLCTLITDASLVGVDPKNMWSQDSERMDVEVKLWREKEVPAPLVEPVKSDKIETPNFEVENGSDQGL